MNGFQNKRANIERLNSGNEEDFINLYKNLHHSLLSYGMRICANEELTRDCIHEVFLELWEKNDRFYLVKEIKPYLFRCLRNLLIDNFKKQKPFLKNTPEETLATGEELSTDSLFSISQEDVIIEKESEDESKRLISNFISKLSSRQKEVFYLKFYDGLSNKEISQVTGIHYQSVRNIISEGIKRIRDFNMELHVALLIVISEILVF